MLAVQVQLLVQLPPAQVSHQLRPLLSWALTANHPCLIIAPSACSSCPVLRHSYQGMGTALIECRSGCTCEPTKLDGTWNRRASLFWSTRVFVSRNRGCPWHASCCAAAVPLPGWCGRCSLSVRCRWTPAAYCASHTQPSHSHPTWTLACLQVSRHPQCLIRVTVLPDPGEFSQEGHKVRGSDCNLQPSQSHPPGPCLAIKQLPVLPALLRPQHMPVESLRPLPLMCPFLRPLPCYDARTSPGCPQVALVAVMVAHLQEGMAQAGTLVHVQQTGEEFRRRHRRRHSSI